MSKTLIKKDLNISTSHNATDFTLCTVVTRTIRQTNGVETAMRKTLTHQTYALFT